MKWQKQPSYWKSLTSRTNVTVEVGMSFRVKKITPGYLLQHSAIVLSNKNRNVTAICAGHVIVVGRAMVLN